ncbi:FadR/GntR family transcriptional regulator [Micromonospora sp. 4G57]|uniref:FadR/GntR family transcriptional regulator n=1 Tax=Micromonospora sicca TaxID=2202420 RepID=A0ABU5JE25_9ACTN|nr:MULTISPECIES: FadR/GntR family transcriptional regulator [unclassified Micromonospora]MDZ5445048.1 FadR/GntR family transcriptional regulator [Micromonospora sp. 4G57]MDZ5490832.1 FadR/GntR family transcriptional regulator [Micromonospora sp. 4G53]
MASNFRISEGSDTSDDMFSRVNIDRASRVIVDQIKMLIHDGRLKPGDRLPSERDLCQRFAVSRVTVREALRMLEAGGLVTIRVGARGGAFVTTPSPEQLGEGLADLLSVSRLTAPNVTEARKIVELGVLPLAMERATDADVQALLAMVEEGRKAVDAGEYTMEMSAAFHVRLAECTHNPAIAMLVHSFHGPMLMSLHEAKVAAPLMGKRGTTEHLEIAEAIRDRDLERAQQIVRVHLDRTAARVQTQATSADVSDPEPVRSP